MATFSHDLEGLSFDRQHIWHPYTSMIDPLPVFHVDRAHGVNLHLRDGRRLVDGMASWWCAIHGYNVPELNQAVKAQLDQMAHVMFGGFTHDPAISLAKSLVSIVPGALERVFFSDSGSVAVEVALKMAMQFFHARSETQKTRFLALKGGYHGDTFHCMSVCDPVTGMHQIYHGSLPQNFFAPRPETRFGDPLQEDDISSLRSVLEENHRQIAAVILEPIVQGAGGMWFYAAEYLREVRNLCDTYGVLLIADEIATGFGRTGSLFACEKAAINADILCLGKALTGGYVSLGATMTTAKVADGISRGIPANFMHGPTFMANPLACHIAKVNIDLLVQGPWKERVAAMETQMTRELANARNSQYVQDVRTLGGIGVIETKLPINVAKAQEILVDMGVWLRPFGHLLYMMPPYVITEAELQTVTQAATQIAYRKDIFFHPT